MTNLKVGITESLEIMGHFNSGTQCLSYGKIEWDREKKGEKEREREGAGLIKGNVIAKLKTSRREYSLVLFMDLRVVRIVKDSKHL